MPDQPAAAADSQQVRQTDRDINRRIEARVDARDAQVFLTGVGGDISKLLRLMRLQTKRLYHTNAGEALLRLIVQRGKGRLRQFKALMQLIAVALDHHRHHRHRHQRQQRKLPADLRTHHNQHRAAHHQRVYQRQYPFAGREDHAVNIVGCARDQIAGAVTQVEFRVLSTELAIEIFPQLHRQLIRSAKQQDAPDVAQQVNHQRGKQHNADPHQNGAAAQAMLGDAIDNHADDFRRQQLQNGNNDQ